MQPIANFISGSSSDIFSAGGTRITNRNVLVVFDGGSTMALPSLATAKKNEIRRPLLLVKE